MRAFSGPLFLLFAFGGGADALRMSIHQQFTIPDCAHQVLSQYDPVPPPALKLTLPKVDAVFVLHAPVLENRRNVLKAELAKAGLIDSATWVTWFNKNDLGNMGELDEEVRKCFFAQPNMFSAGVRSLSMKHLWVYTHMMRKGLQNVVVMEDDAAFNYGSFPSPAQSLNDLVAEVPHDYDMVQLSGCLGMHAGKNKINEHLYGPGYASRCASGYLVSLKGATAMAERIFKTGIDLPADHEINQIGKAAGYWYEPYLWDQSELGGTTVSL